MLLDHEAWQALVTKLQLEHPSAMQIVRGETMICLDGGIGPAFYLAASGRIAVVDEARCDFTRTDAFGSLRAAARRTDVTAFIALLPPRPSDAVVCARCRGRAVAPPASDASVGMLEFPCKACEALGWRMPDGAP